MVAEQERGLRAETLAAANAGGMARNYSQQAPLDTVRMILAHGAAGRL